MWDVNKDFLFPFILSKELVFQSCFFCVPVDQWLQWLPCDSNNQAEAHKGMANTHKRYLCQVDKEWPLRLMSSQRCAATCVQLWQSYSFCYTGKSAMYRMITQFIWPLSVLLIWLISQFCVALMEVTSHNLQRSISEG